MLKILGFFDENHEVLRPHRIGFGCGDDGVNVRLRTEKGEQIEIPLLRSQQGFDEQVRQAVDVERLIAHEIIDRFELPRFDFLDEFLKGNACGFLFVSGGISSHHHSYFKCLTVFLSPRMSFMHSIPRATWVAA